MVAIIVGAVIMAVMIVMAAAMGAHANAYAADVQANAHTGAGGGRPQQGQGNYGRDKRFHDCSLSNDCGHRRMTIVLRLREGAKLPLVPYRTV